MANKAYGDMTTAPPDDDFDNALAVFHHDLRAIMSEADCQTVVDRIRSVHASWPDMPFADAAELVRATMTGLVSLKTVWNDLGTGDEPGAAETGVLPADPEEGGQLVNWGQYVGDLLAPRPCGHAAGGGDCDTLCEDGDCY